uniref:ARAD1D34276p n=1 Tax=Blastobotrys adeninivorans TaxID=409370 RepID=A0A060TBD2_BLAAD
MSLDLASGAEAGKDQDVQRVPREQRPQKDQEERPDQREDGDKADEDKEETSIRHRKLQELSARTLQQAVKVLTLEKVQSCYPTIASSDTGKENLRKAIKQIVDHWQNAAQQEFDAIYQERDIRKKMVQLDALIEEARARKSESSSGNVDPRDMPVMVGELTPEQIIDSHLADTKKRRIKELSQQLEQARARNQALSQSLTDTSNQVMTEIDHIRQHLDKVDNAIQSNTQLPSRRDLASLVSVLDL